MRFIHTADWQIGKSFGRFGDKAEALRGARLDAIEAIGRLAVAEGVDHVLVAGDVFDSETPTNLTLRAPMERMRGFPRVTWHLLPGNHDPHRPGGVWDRLLAIGQPENVRAHLESTPVELTPQAWLLPSPLRHKSETRDLTEWMSTAVTPAGAIRIGLAHGAVTQFGEGDGEAGNPIDPARATKAGLDYLALGDWHRTQEIGPRVWYAGTPEPDRHDSQTIGAALVVTIAQAGVAPRVERRTVGTYRWAATTLELTEVAQLAAEEARLRAVHDPLSRLVLRARLTGVTTIAERRILDAWLERLEASVFSLDATLAMRLRPQREEIEAIDLDGVLARVAETLRARTEDATLAAAEREVAEDALMMLYLEATSEREQAS
jgi:DNA repair exonuclease SbcCD nuclease subunit